MPSASEVNSYLANLTSLSGEDWARSSGEWSSIMTSFQNANATSIANDLAIVGETPVTGIRTTEYQNVSIAYGVTIEDATGGSARDLLWGNDVANVLKDWRQRRPQGLWRQRHALWRRRQRHVRLRQ